MSYINQYNDAGTLYDLQDKRIDEISSGDVGKTVVAYEDPDTHVRSFQFSNHTQSTGNLSLSTSTNQYDVTPNTLPWNAIYQWNKEWYGALGSDGSAQSGGAIVKSKNGYTFTAVQRGSSAADHFYSLSGGKSALVASSYTVGGQPKLYFSPKGDADTWTAETLPTLPTGSSIANGTKLDIIYGDACFMAIPHQATPNVVLYSTGLTTIDNTSTMNWQAVAISSEIAPMSNIIYDSGFKYLRFTGQYFEVYVFDMPTKTWIRESKVLLGDTAQSAIWTSIDGIIYACIQTSSNTYLLHGDTPQLLTLIGSGIAGQSPCAIANMTMFTVIGTEFLIWNNSSSSTNTYLSYYDFSSGATTFNTRDIKFTGGTIVSPTNIFTYDDQLYGTILDSQSKVKLYTSNNRGISWNNGTFTYVLQQSSDGQDQDITRILINLVKTDPNTFKLSANEVGAITAPANVQDGQVIQYHAATESWIAVNMPSSIGYKRTFTAAIDSSNWIQESGTTNYLITVAAATHGCGVNPIVDVYTLVNSNYEKFYGYPSTGWKVRVASNGDVSLIVSSGATFAGELLIK